MKQELLCITSDAVNRYGMMVTTEAMEKSLKETYDLGIPLLLGHDFHKPIGWNVPFGLFIEPGLTRLLAKKIQATNTDDLKTVRKAVGNFLARSYEKDFLLHEAEFMPLVQQHLSADHHRIRAGCIAIIDKGLTKRMFPELFSSDDKDGLVPLPSLLKTFAYLGQGIFKHKDSKLTVYAHHFFRRSQSRFNNFYFHFLDELLFLANDSKITIKIRIDEDMIGFGPSYHESGELEFHYGPKYSDDISEIKPGIARHICNESDKKYYEVGSTEFYWKNNKQEKIFETEELRAFSSPADDLYHCRYMHSIYDSVAKEFIHFDGAIRTYNETDMRDRENKTFVEYGRKAIYKKLFRIDGKLPLEKWKLLITHYYQGNPLIYEYFGLKDERDAFKVENPFFDRMQTLLPFEIKKDEGLKLLVSYHSKPEDLRPGRYLDIPDVMGSEEEKFYCIEKMVYEVKKVLQSIGADLDIPSDWVLLKFDDRYWNIPSIMHSGDDIPRKLQTTVRALILLFQDMIEKKVDLDISLSLAFEMNERIVRISSYGNIHNQLYWLQNNICFEHTEESLTQWVVAQRKYLNKFSRNIESPLLASITQLDGVLFIKRIPVMFDYKFGQNELGLTYTISFPENDGALKLCNNNQIRPVVCIKVHKAIWADTGEDYYTSRRSRLGSDSTVTISEWEPLALYWTKGTFE